MSFKCLRLVALCTVEIWNSWLKFLGAGFSCTCILASRPRPIFVVDVMLLYTICKWCQNVDLWDNWKHSMRVVPHSFLPFGTSFHNYAIHCRSVFHTWQPCAWHFLSHFYWTFFEGLGVVSCLLSTKHVWTACRSCDASFGTSSLYAETCTWNGE